MRSSISRRARLTNTSNSTPSQSLLATPPHPTRQSNHHLKESGELRHRALSTGLQSRATRREQAWNHLTHMQRRRRPRNLVGCRRNLQRREREVMLIMVPNQLPVSLKQQTKIGIDGRSSGTSRTRVTDPERHLHFLHLLRQLWTCP